MTSQVRSCPKTGGRPVKMTRQGWDKVCAAARAEADGEFQGWHGGPSNSGSMFISACLTCSGEIPAEVTIIELSQLNTKQENDMSNKGVRKQGTCEFCRDQKMVMPILGKDTCTMCENLRSQIRNRPHVVVASLLELAPSALPPGSANDAELKKMRGLLDDQVAICEDRQQELEQANTELSKVKAMLQDALATKPAPVNQFDVAYDRRCLTDLALRLAIGTMKGEIEGIAAEDIELLRSI